MLSYPSLRLPHAGPWERYKGLMELMGGVVAFAVVVYGALYVIVLLAGAWWGAFWLCSG